jgi:hypothetical protein
MTWIMSVMSLLFFAECAAQNIDTHCDHAQPIDYRALRTICYGPLTQESVLPPRCRLPRRGVAPTGVFADIANQPGYLGAYSVLRALQLLERHVRPGMSLRELRSMLAGASWLDEKCVHTLLGVGGGGYIPVVFNPHSDSVFSLHVCPPECSPCVYISLASKISASDLIKALRGECVGAAIENVRVVDVVVQNGS